MPIIMKGVRADVEADIKMPQSIWQQFMIPSTSQSRSSGPPNTRSCAIGLICSWLLIIHQKKILSDSIVSEVSKVR